MRALSFSSSSSPLLRRRLRRISKTSRRRACSSARDAKNASTPSSEKGRQKEDKKVFFAFGFGYCAIGIANQLARLKKEEWTIVGTTRSDEKAEVLNLRSNGTWCKEVYTWKSDDGEPLDEKCESWLKIADVVLISTPPNGDLDLDPILSTKRVKEVLDGVEKRQMFIYLSSTGVYGGHRGEWVDETTEPNPDSIVGQRRLNAEKAWTEWVLSDDNKKSTRSSLRIFRLGGIYGPGRSAIDIAAKRKRERQFQEKTSGKEENVQSEGRNSISNRDSDNNNIKNLLTPTQLSRRKKIFTSRIHVADIANSVIRCIEKEVEEREEEDTTNSNRRVVIYNVVDDYPSSRDEAVHFAANLLGYENEDNIGNNKLNSKDTHPDRSEKRVKNGKLKREVLSSSSSSLPSLLFPSFKEGLRAIRDGNQIPFD